MSEARKVHDMEQALAALAVVAASVARYYLALLSEGVPPEHALLLAAQFQQQITAQARGEQGS
jgi:hypothetical protein